VNGVAVRVKVEEFTDRQLDAVIAGGQQPAKRFAQIEKVKRLNEAYDEFLADQAQAELRNERFFEEGF
jgi:hypothetical protein